MTIRFVGIGGSNANNGLTWATRKLTLNGAEDTPVVAGDTIYVGAGAYRETLTVDVSGTFGNQISYIGDYTGENTDGVGGVVRVTGSDNDQTATRANCITATNKGNRSFQGFTFDTTTGAEITATTSSNWVISNCFFHPCASNQLSINGIQASWTIQNCVFWGAGGPLSVAITHSVVVDNSGHVFQNCLFLGGGSGIQTNRVGGITVKNSTFLSCRNNAIQIGTALSAGQTVTVNNSVFQGNGTVFSATVLGEITENFNTLFANNTARTNTATGTSSVIYPALLDTRWFFQAVTAGAGPYNPVQVITPFDLSPQSQIINLAGASPSTTDMRGTLIQDTQREWGTLEFDPTLSIKARQASSIDGGGMVV